MGVITDAAYKKEDKIILMTMPFLTPACPPLGISCLKGYIQQYGYNVKTVDVMCEMEIREKCYLYFDKLAEYIPVEKRGHFFNVGLDVLCNHFMAHINQNDKEKYIALIKDVIYKNYYVEVDDGKVKELDKIVDSFYISIKEFILELIKREQPKIVGISVYRGTLAASMFAFGIIKEYFPDIMTVMGGAIFSQELFINTPNYDYFIEITPYIDKILIGEGEQLFLKLLRGELPKGQRTYTIEDIDNDLLDLNHIPLPDFSDLHLSSYSYIPHYTSRGCIYRCSFCAETIYWKKYRNKSVAKIADEFIEQSNKFGKNIFLLTDCLINPIVTDLSKELIKRELKLYWDVYLKVDNKVCDPEYTFLWRRGGFYRARLGIESGSQKVLDLIDKRITVEQIRAALISLANAGIKTTTYWFAGHPGETEEDFRQTLDLLEELQDNIYEAECDPFRYFYRGQVNTDIWDNTIGNTLLYPEEYKSMLVTQTWSLNAEPSREEIYSRACRFRNECKRLGIPNPYSVSEIHHADERWKKLHKNSVPALLELNKQTNISEEMNTVSRVLVADSTNMEDTDFDF